MSLPPIVSVTIEVVLVTAWSWFASRSDVFAPEQATNVSDVFDRFCATRYG